MKEENYPFVSIVVIAYNEEKGIDLTLNSLLNQDYPKNRYEIIVVDDCSKDKTTEFVKKFPVRLIKHKRNLGRPQARNTGLKHAKGEIYVSFDGDCIADRDFLKELIKVYKTKKDVLGVGGNISSPSTKRLTDKFIQANRYGNPMPLYVTKSKSIIMRLISYLRLEVNSSISNNNEIKFIFKVGEIMGANSSFYVNDLKEIDGWDINLSSKEDTDICYRLRNNFKDKSFYVNKKAKIIHNHNLTFFDYIKSPFLRGTETIKLCKKQKRFLPIFPFPLITILLSIFLAFFNIWFLPLSLILIPQILYFWWFMKSIKELKIYPLLFPYMQLLLELFTILGLIRGYYLLMFNNGGFKNFK